MDISSRNGWPSNRLSNFAANRFVVDDVVCGGMEGFLQSLKFEDPEVQLAVCALSGATAKKRGSARTRAWQAVQTLWWRGAAMDRHGPAYQALLDRAFRAMFEQSRQFRTALAATGKAELSHAMGRTDPRESILTAAEFCGRLLALRAEIAADEGLIDNPFPACHPCH
jgi:hypothetical protein